MKKGKVLISIDEENVIVSLNTDIRYSELVMELEEEFMDFNKKYKGSFSKIFLRGRELSKKELKEVEIIIKEEIEIDIVYENPKDLGLHTIKRTFDEIIETSNTKFFKLSVRSGQEIEHEGSIVLIGDVNGGGRVIAAENVVVLGTIRGTVHAGAKGNKGCIIAAEKIENAQIRIADLLKEVEDKDEIDIHKTPYFYIKDNKIAAN